MAEHPARWRGPGRRLRSGQHHRLPLRDNTVDAVISIAALQLIPDPTAALVEIGRVLKPGGRFALMVPTVDSSSLMWRLLPKAGARVFGDDEIADTREGHGFTSVRTRNFGTIQWVRGRLGGPTLI